MNAPGGKCSKAVIVSFATLAIAAAGCGSSSSSSDEDRINGVFGDLQDAMAARDYDGLCAATTTDAHHQAGQLGHKKEATCQRDMRQLVAMVRNAPVTVAPPKIVRLKIDGGRAIAVVVAGRSRTRVPFAKEDGDWKVDALYGGIPAGKQPDKFPSTF